MKHIKVFLQKPWFKVDSSYYKLLKKKLPENINYFIPNKDNLISKQKNLRINDFMKQSMKKILKKFFPFLPNAHYTKNAKGYDLIHCAHCISKNKHPWVCDVEFVGQFWAKGETDKNDRKIKKYLESDYCKKILAWSKWSKQTVISKFPDLEGKIEILYPAIGVGKKIKKKDKKIRILFVGRNFEVKGGKIAIKVIKKLVNKYSNVEGIFVSNVPDQIKNNYKEKSIKFFNLVSQKELFEKFYPNADIFLYPTFSDTFGFSILEAQSFGLPVIAMKTRSTHTIDETILNEKTGFIINNLGANNKNKIFDAHLINEFVDKCESLIKNSKRLKEMSANAKKEISDGRFSIKKRNKKLVRIFNAAIH